MSVCIVWRRRQRLDEARLRLSQKGLRIVRHVADADQHVHAGDADERVDIARIQS